MINKKNVLGKVPTQLGDKDAIHVAIAAVVAGRSMEPGQRCSIKDGIATPDSKGIGVADPFRRGTIMRGKPFWLLLSQDAVPNVQHVWEHPTANFGPPSSPPALNSTLMEYAQKLGVTYDELISAGTYVVDNDKPATYTGTLSKDELEEVCDEAFSNWEFWSEWAEETLYEFENIGSECCPEYQYPDCNLFKFAE